MRVTVGLGVLVTVCVMEIVGDTVGVSEMVGDAVGVMEEERDTVGVMEGVRDSVGVTECVGVALAGLADTELLSDAVAVAVDVNVYVLDGGMYEMVGVREREGDLVTLRVLDTVRVDVEVEGMTAGLTLAAALPLGVNESDDVSVSVGVLGAACAPAHRRQAISPTHARFMKPTLWPQTP